MDVCILFYCLYFISLDVNVLIEEDDQLCLTRVTLKRHLTLKGIVECIELIAQTSKFKMVFLVM